VDERVTRRIVHTPLVAVTTAVLLTVALAGGSIAAQPLPLLPTPDGTIVVGGNPTALAVSPSGRTLFATLFDTNAVAVISVGTRTVDATIPVDANPQSIDITADGRWVVVASYDENTVSVIDARRLTVVQTVPVGSAPTGVTIARRPGRDVVYTANSNDGSVSWFRVGDATSTTITGVAPPMALAPIEAVPDGRTVYAGDFNDNRLVTIDTATNAVTGAIVLPDDVEPTGLAVDTRGATIWVAGFGSIGVVDVATGHVTEVAPAAGVAEAVALTRNRRLALVTNAADAPDPGALQVIDRRTNATLGTVPADGFPEDIELGRADRLVFVANSGGGTVGVYRLGG
jgi:YVTN family beta-propeller protein